MKAPADGTQAIAVVASANSKIGEAATTYVEQRSCPTTCRFRDGGGCYAEEGQVGKFVTGPLNRAAQTVPDAHAGVRAAEAEAAAIDALEVVDGRPLRLHTVGDCSTTLAAVIVSEACARYRRRGGGPVWTYTHAWRDVPRDAWRGIDGRADVSVFASCETAEDVTDAQARGYATAIVVDSFPSDKRYEIASPDSDCGDAQTATGGQGPVAVVPCPNQTRGVTCSDCRFCFKSESRLHAGVSVGFAIHGNGLTVSKARAALDRPDDPDRRLTSRQLIPRVEARWLERHGRKPTTTEIARELHLNPSSVSQMRRRLSTEGGTA